METQSQKQHNQVLEERDIAAHTLQHCADALLEVSTMSGHDLPHCGVSEVSFSRSLHCHIHSLQKNRHEIDIPQNLHLSDPEICILDEACRCWSAHYLRASSFANRILHSLDWPYAFHLL